MKLYYSIGEVADMIGVNQSLLRFWETEFPQLKPHKHNNGIRAYTEKDIDLIRQIFHLTKECGYTLDGARLQLRKGNPNVDGAQNDDATRNNDAQRIINALQSNQKKVEQKLRQARQGLIELKESIHTL